MKEENNIELKINKINQLVNKQIYLGQMNIISLKEIIKYTNRIPNPEFSIEYENNTEIEYKYYQRIKNSDRAYDIKMFFLKNIWNKYHFDTERISPLGTFPSSIILAFNSFESEDQNEFKNYTKNEKNAENVFINNNYDSIIIPKSNQGLIVDGQHRIAGLELLLDEAKQRNIIVRKGNKKDYYTNLRKMSFEYIVQEIENFNFIVSFLIDFDLYEQAEIFATVNFNQQKVNRSFYYDIFGSVSSSKTIEKLLHDITTHLNYKDDSPLLNKIKMLGNGPGYISQAFFVDAMIPYFKSGIFQFVYSDFQNGGTIYKNLPNFLKLYFSTIFNIYKSFLPKSTEKSYPNVLLKTTGMGALIRLMPIIFNEIKTKERISTSKEVFLLDNSKISDIINGLFKDISTSGEKYFGENSSYSKGSGKGLQNKLFEQLIQDLGLSKNNNNNLMMEPLL